VLLLDVNVLLHGFRDTATDESVAVRRWLVPRLTGAELLGVSEWVLASVVRLSTNPRIFIEPASPSAALEYCSAVLAAPSVQVVRPGARHWAIFAALVHEHRLRGNDIPDAYLASLALESGATLVTVDRGFRRFETLRLVSPLDAEVSGRG
jgi:toxin-antitoxin system PIN domain toxin